jgi:ribosomal protein L31E
MTRYTVNLGRARAAGRKNRARKAISILREELERKEGDVTLSREVNQEIWKDGASRPPNKISVNVEEVDGEKKVYPAEEKESPQGTSSTSGSSTDSEEKDYSQAVSGTIDESKEAIKEMDNPDYDALLDAEKSGKDRKTLKDWIESRKE